MPPGEQAAANRELRQGHNGTGQTRRSRRAELRRQRAYADPAIALNRLEIVQGHDPVSAQAVQGGHNQYGATGERPAEHQHGAGDPGQPLVAETHGGVPIPAVLLEPDRGRAIGPGQRQGQGGGGYHPGAQHAAEQERQQGPEHGVVQPPTAGDATRGYGPPGLVDGIDVAIEPVVGDLAGAADPGPDQHDARDKRERSVRQGRPRRDRAAYKGPHRREPGDGFEQFQQGARGNTTRKGTGASARGVRS